MDFIIGYVTYLKPGNRTSMVNNAVNVKTLEVYKSKKPLKVLFQRFRYSMLLDQWTRRESNPQPSDP